MFLLVIYATRGRSAAHRHARIAASMLARLSRITRIQVNLRIVCDWYITHVSIDGVHVNEY
jgi:hypothetical protein